MTPSWYDILDVDEDATSAEIRTAWRTAIADLDPGDRRFRLANQAAEVLLDPERRAAHDAELAGDVPDDDPDVVATAEPAAVEEDAGDDVAEDVEDDQPATTAAARGRRPVAGLGARSLVLAVVAALLLALTVVALVQGRDRADADAARLPDARDVEDARGSAEAAVVPVLAYDYRTLQEDQAEARTYLTDRYAAEYDDLFTKAVETNAERTRTVIRVQFLESAIVRTGEDRVDVLVFVNRRTTNKQRSQDYFDQVTMRMLDVDGTWLVDCLVTSEEGRCESDDSD